jgi:hypothetical protein
MKMPNAFVFILFGSILFSCSKSSTGIKTSGPPLPGSVEKTDTLKVMAYNVLKYGDLCQGNTSRLNGYLYTILQFTQPDLVSCEKMQAFNIQRGSPGNLADDILENVLNKSIAGKYDYAMPTNASGSGTISVLFYNKKKLTYVNTKDVLSLVTDFDLYKFYYNDVNLSITKDTTFLYTVVFHTKSGSGSVERDFQDSAVMASLQSKFSSFPNLLMMGDFNTRGSFEHGYQSITNSTDSSISMSDPPYFPDQLLQYPGNWSTSPSFVSSFLTTSTRALSYQPNSCGSDGGGKGWYDHIFISNWLVNGTNYMKYIPLSYQSFGNDGNRTGASINSSTPSANTSVPPDVLDALFHFSDKYPVMLNLRVKANRNAVSPQDPNK